MSATVDIKKFKQIVKILARSKQYVNIPTYVHGKKGVGKSEITKQIADDMSFDFSVINLASQTPEELLGLPNRDSATNTMTYLPPDWLKLGSTQNTIYFLDEINRAPKFVLQPIFPFILEGRLHRHHIKNTDYVVAAGNPADLNHDVTEFEDAAFTSRFAHFYLEPTKEEYVSYLKSIGCHQSIVESISLCYPKIENYTDPKYKIKSTPDNRNIAKIGILFNHMSAEEINEVGIYICSALVGPDIAPIIMLNYKNSNNLPSPEDIIENSIEIPKITVDQIQVMNIKIVQYVSKIVDLDKKQFQNMSKYMKTLPKDAQMSFISQLKNAIGTVQTITLFQKYDLSYISDLLNF